MGSKSKNYKKYWNKKLGLQSNSKSRKLLEDYLSFTKVYKKSHGIDYSWDVIRCSKVKLNKAEQLVVKNIHDKFYKEFDTIWNSEYASLMQFDQFLNTIPKQLVLETEEYISKVATFFKVSKIVSKINIILLTFNKYGVVARSNEKIKNHILLTHPGKDRNNIDMYASYLHELTHLMEFSGSSSARLLKDKFILFISIIRKDIFGDREQTKWDDIKELVLEPLITSMSSCELSYFRMSVLNINNKKDKELRKELLERKFNDNPKFLKYHIYAIAVRIFPIVRLYLDNNRVMDEEFVNIYLQIWKKYICVTK